MKDRDGNEWVLVPCEATEEMLIAGLNDCDPIGSLIDWDDSKGECTTRKNVADIYKAAIAAAPQFVAGEADDALCERIGRDCAEVTVNAAIMHAPARLPIDYAAFGAGMIAAVRSELGPALGLVEIREPTPEECERICMCYLGLDSPPSFGAKLGREVFDAVSAVMWPKEGL